MKRNTCTLLTTSLLLALTGSASAMEATLNDGFVVVDDAAHPHDDATSTSTWIQTISDGSHVYKLRMENDSMFVTVDGKSVPDSRIKKEKDIVFVFNADGSELIEFDLSMSVDTPPNVPRLPQTRASGNRAIIMGHASSGNNQGFAFTKNVPGTVIYDDGTTSRPKVMLGIYSDEPGESLREHLGIKGDAIIVQSVIKGLSADKAGIKDHDIIISIDGSDGVSQNTLTKILNKHNPGDEIKIIVLRKGQEMKLNTKLLEYNADALGHSSTTSNNIWITEEESSFPSILHNDSQGLSRLDRFFSPETREKTHAKIIEALKSQGISDKKIAQIESQLVESLDRDIWNAFGKDDQGNFFEFRTDEDDNASAHRFPIESMQRKAEQAMRDAERLTLQYKDGQLLLKRHAEGLEQKVKELNERVQGSLPIIESELQDRLGMLEDRLDTLEEALDSQMDSLSGLIERLIDRLDEED